MKVESSVLNKYEITYEVGGSQFTSTQTGMDSIDAARRFERRVGFRALRCKAI